MLSLTSKREIEIEITFRYHFMPMMLEKNKSLTIPKRPLIPCWWVFNYFSHLEEQFDNT